MSGSVRVCDGSRARSNRSSSSAASRIGRSDLVVDEDATAGNGDACQLCCCQLRSRDVMERPPRAGEIERAILEGKVRRIPFDERHVRGRVAARVLQELRDDVDADHLANERRERQRKRPGAGAAVERTVVSARLDEGAELLPHHLDLSRGVLRNELGRRAEARANVLDVGLSHRSASFAPAGARSRCRRRARS